MRRLIFLLLFSAAAFADTDAAFVEQFMSADDLAGVAPDQTAVVISDRVINAPAPPPSLPTAGEPAWRSPVAPFGVPSAASQFNPPPLPPERSPKMLAPPMFIPSVTFPYDVRQPTGVNLYYPADARLLRRQLQALDTPTALEPVPGVAKVFIAPWGTLDGALPVAAKVYQYLRQRGNVKTVVLVARPHGEPLAGPASVWAQGGYATPLGIAKINALAARRLATNPDVNFEPAAHQTDAAIETNVILAQYFLPDAQIVPVLVNPRLTGDAENLCRALAKIVAGDGVVLVAITNLSYGFPEREVAGRYDLQTLAELQTLDLNIINNLGKKREQQLYPGAGIIDAPRVAMAAVLTGLWLEMDTLTWFGYDAPRQFPGAPLLTGCAAGALSARAKTAIAETTRDGTPIVRLESGRLSDAAAREMLTIARDSLQAAAALARYDAPYPRSPELLHRRAVFVTVVGKDGVELASMGTLNQNLPLAQGVAEAARMCALGEDPQMPKRLNSYDAQTGALEVSVLKNLRPAAKWEDVKNGQGIMVARGSQRSVVLPGTAERHRWSVEDALAFACRRAGLQPNAYRSARVDIWLFDVDRYPAEK
ncbi:hypothetical protein AGMMS49959_03590 [Planctomycetales bacterium]|nr:hypothetical protein AGMMS49959_03590 [Planctomycetales bacterium]